MLGKQRQKSRYLHDAVECRPHRAGGRKDEAVLERWHHGDPEDVRIQYHPTREQKDGPTCRHLAYTARHHARHWACTDLSHMATSQKNLP